VHNQDAREQGHPSEEVSTVHGERCVDEECNLVHKQPRVYTILDSTVSSRSRQRSRSADSQESTRLSSPLPTKSYGGSAINFSSETPRQSTVYEGSIVGFPPSAVPVDPFQVPRASAGIIGRRYLRSEENTSQQAEKDDQERGMDETRNVYTPIHRKFDISDSEDDMMTEVEWKDEEL